MPVALELGNGFKGLCVFLQVQALEPILPDPVPQGRLNLAQDASPGYIMKHD
jgi:hypothetical protein